MDDRSLILSTLCESASTAVAWENPTGLIKDVFDFVLLQSLRPSVSENHLGKSASTAMKRARSVCQFRFRFEISSITSLHCCIVPFLVL